MAYNEFARLYNNIFTKASWQRLALNKERNGYSYEKIYDQDIMLYLKNIVDYEYKLSQQGYNRIKANLSTNNQNSTKYLQATREDLSKYLNPQTNTTNPNRKLQIKKKDKNRQGITASELNAFFNKYCKSYSVFINKGQAFVDAAKKHNLDAIHDTVHEMCKDEARHGKAFLGLLERHFGKQA